MYNTVMRRPYRPRRLPVIAGLGALAVLSAGLTPAAVAEPVPSSTEVTLRSGTTLVSDWYINNDHWAQYPGLDDCVNDYGYDDGLAIRDAVYDVDGDYRTDPFDTGLAFYVGKHRLVAGETWDVATDTGGINRAVTASGIAAGDLTATVEYRTMSDQQVLRSTVWLTNPGSEPVTTQLGVGNNLGSDWRTAIVGTRSGDTKLTDTDRWLITTDGDEDDYADPVLTHVLAGPGVLAAAPTETKLGITEPESECFEEDDLRHVYPVTVQPGATVGVLLLTEMSGTGADALAAAARFNTTPGATDALLAGFSEQQRAAIFNWNFTPPAPPAPRDGTPPTSAAAGPARTAQATWTVTYNAADIGFGVRAVDLYVKAPNETTFTKVATDTGALDGEFTYTGTSDGDYAFYSTATDHGGNVEAAPATADITTLLDQTAPVSRSTTTPLRNQTTIPVTYVTDDANGVGVATVDLFVKAPGQTSFTKTATDTDLDGAFTYTAARAGVYAFYTSATDRLGNVESAQTAADTVTRIDLTAPALSAKMGQTPILFDISEQAPLLLRMRVSERADVVFLVRQRGNLVRKLGWNPVERGLVEQKWHGRDTDRRLVTNGRYKLVIKAQDLAGNRSVLRLPMRVTR